MRLKKKKKNDEYTWAVQGTNVVLVFVFFFFIITWLYIVVHSVRSGALSSIIIYVFKYLKEQKVKYFYYKIWWFVIIVFLCVSCYSLIKSINPIEVEVFKVPRKEKVVAKDLAVHQVFSGKRRSSCFCGTNCLL